MTQYGKCMCPKTETETCIWNALGAAEFLRPKLGCVFAI